MISRGKLAANRANAKRSTGPKTPEGKARASRNARRHGLAVPVTEDPDLIARIAALAEAFLEGNARHLDPLRRHGASLLAAGEIDLARIRKEQTRLMAQALDAADPDHTAPAFGQSLNRLERYERRARARRQAGLRLLTGAANVQDMAKVRSAWAQVNLAERSQPGACP